MKALYLTHHFPRAEELRIPLVERPDPVLKKGECLLEVHASGVNPSDGLGAIGYFAHAKLPRIPGRDFAGVVLSGAHKGTKVWGTGGAMGIEADGSHAALMALPESALAPIPSNMTLLQASAQTLPYTTAYYSLVTRCRLSPGERVLVLGALGQVGRAAMSLSQWKGAQATAFVRHEKLQQAQALGWDATCTLSAQSYDVILNATGNVYWKDLHLAPFGRMAIIAALPKERQASLDLFEFYRSNLELEGINTVALDVVENAQLLNEMRPGFESGALQPLPLDPATLFPLEQADLAYRKVLAKSASRVVLRIQE